MGRVFPFVVASKILQSLRADMTRKLKGYLLFLLRKRD